MFLSNVEIRRRCVAPLFGDKPLLEPFSECIHGPDIISGCLSHAGYDLRLGNKVLIFKNTFDEIMDPLDFKRRADYYKRVFDSIEDLRYGERVILPAHSYLLAYSQEKINMPDDLIAITLGKSTYARMGLIVNCTPAEPGWSGHLTVEIANASSSRAAIYVGHGIAQMLFGMIFGEVDVNYAAKGGGFHNQGAEPVPIKG